MTRFKYIDEAEQVWQLVNEHGTKSHPDAPNITIELLLHGLLAAHISQAKSLESVPYAPGQDWVHVRGSGDTREQILHTAFWEARQFFGPGRALAVAEQWTAQPNLRQDHRKLGRFYAEIMIREVPGPSDEEFAGQWYQVNPGWAGEGRLVSGPLTAEKES